MMAGCTSALTSSVWESVGRARASIPPASCNAAGDSAGNTLLEVGTGMLFDFAVKIVPVALHRSPRTILYV
eukprot:3360972-Rhodomonas_salina.1